MFKKPRIAILTKLVFCVILFCSLTNIGPAMVAVCADYTEVISTRKEAPMSKKALPKGVYKRTPEDFVVQEILWDAEGNTYPLGLYTESLIRGYDPDYPVTVFCMTKVNMETKTAMETVSALLGVPEENTSYQGLKDKRACTSMLVGVEGPFNSDFEHEQVSLVQLYGQQDYLQSGRGYWGNYFTINVESNAAVLDFKAVEKVLNVFGTQRIGDPGSEDIGRFLFEGRFDEAAELLLKSGNKHALRRARQSSGGGWVDALFHHNFKHYLRFEVRKWQSWLWNKLAQEELAAGKLTLSDDERLPFWQLDRMVVDRYRHLWIPPDKIHPEVVRLMDRQRRPTSACPEGFRAKYKNGVWRFSFSLKPSVYATVVLSQLFELDQSFDSD